MKAPPPQLSDLVRTAATQPVSPAVRALAEHLRKAHPDAAQAILFYGSCLRSGDDRDGIVDLYLLVDTYHRTYAKHIWAALNKLLPPNVYYLEVPFQQRVVRAKYAVLSLADFQRGTSADWFHSYIWGRFAQPTALIYARDASVADLVQRCLAEAVRTMARQVLPQLPERFSARDFWSRGLALSYRAELRAERPGKLARLYDDASAYYTSLTAALVSELPPGAGVSAEGPTGFYRNRQPDAARRRSRWMWRVRFVQGKLLSALRLLKGWATFAGGTDYILWKIERHSGVSEELTPYLRRHPLLAVCVVGWRLYRKGGFR